MGGGVDALGETGNESPRATKLYDRTSDELTLDEIKPNRHLNTLRFLPGIRQRTRDEFGIPLNDRTVVALVLPSAGRIDGKESLHPRSRSSPS